MIIEIDDQHQLKDLLLKRYSQDFYQWLFNEYCDRVLRVSDIEDMFIEYPTLGDLAEDYQNVSILLYDLRLPNSATMSELSRIESSALRRTLKEHEHQTEFVFLYDSVVSIHDY